MPFDQHSSFVHGIDNAVGVASEEQAVGGDGAGKSADGFEYGCIGDGELPNEGAEGIDGVQVVIDNGEKNGCPVDRRTAAAAVDQEIIVVGWIPFNKGPFDSMAWNINCR